PATSYQSPLGDCKNKKQNRPVFRAFLRPLLATALLAKPHLQRAKSVKSRKVDISTNDLSSPRTKGCSAKLIRICCCSVSAIPPRFYLHSRPYAGDQTLSLKRIVRDGSHPPVD
ncbi:MAG TPA: hypothetical protein PKJ50_17405, partial [Casimicrobium huifangae]|nr:hypothetical protein [Casimicrobium huifangae]